MLNVLCMNYIQILGCEYSGGGLMFNLQLMEVNALVEKFHERNM